MVRKGDYERIVGTKQKVLNEQADRYGIPCGGATVDLAAVAGSLHELLAINKHKRLVGLNGHDGDDDDRQDDDGEAIPTENLERLRKEQWRIKRLERKRIEGQTADVKYVREEMLRHAVVFRALIEGLERDGHRIPAERAREAVTEFIGRVEASGSGNGASSTKKAIAG